MPFTRPTLSELRTQVEQDVLSSIGAVGKMLRKSILRAVTWAQAALAHLHYGYLDWIALQAVPYTATGEYIEAWGGLKAVTRKSATSWVGTIAFSGTVGKVIPSGTSISRSDGATYTTSADATVASGGTVTVTATADTAGTDYNCDAGVTMTLVSAISGIQSAGEAASTTTTGTDVEDDDDYRDRVLEAFQVTPQGGSKDDYVTWAEEVSGVTRAWCNPNGFGAGTVVVYVMLDDAESAHSGFPQGTDGVATSETRGTTATGDQLTVANYIHDLQQPVTALVYVCSPIASPVNFAISGVGSAYQTAATAAIQDLFTRDSSPGSMTNSDGSPTGKITLLSVWQAVASVTGLTDFVIISPSADISASTGYMPTVGSITYS